MKAGRLFLAAVIAAGCIFSSVGCSEAPQGNVAEVVLEEGDKIAEITVEGYGTIKAKLYPEYAPVGVENFIKLAESGYYDGKNVHRVINDFMLQGGSLNGDGTGGEAANGGSFGIETSESMRHFYGALCYANSMGNNTTQFYIVNNDEPQDIKDKQRFNPEDIQMAIVQYAAARDKYEPGSDYYNFYNATVIHYNNLIEMLENSSDEVIAKYQEMGGTPSLDGGYTVFGQVYEGFDVIDSISACEVEDNGNGEVSKPVDTITITSVKITDYTAES